MKRESEPGRKPENVYAVVARSVSEELVPAYHIYATTSDDPENPVDEPIVTVWATDGDDAGKKARLVAAMVIVGLMSPSLEESLRKVEVSRDSHAQPKQPCLRSTRP